MSKVHIKKKSIPLCKVWSYDLQFATKYNEVTCKVCKAFYDIQKGKISEAPFGGNYKSDGTIRDNINGNRWSGDNNGCR